MLFDAHVHLGWFDEPAAVAREAGKRGLGLLAVTVTPDEYRALRAPLSGEKNVALAAGLHPWWVRDASEADELVAALPQTRWVGEVGLDASPRHAATYGAQLAAFERVCAACAETSDPSAPVVISVHAVRAATDALDVLERTGAAERCRCVLHWFSGSSEELARARALGCWFSFGERALATRRGREYARQVPAGRLLLETDLPAAPGETGGVEVLLASLGRAVDGIAAARGEDAGEVETLLARNAEELLS
ncbi:TatD family hydrolase [Olsenella profusa]|uniref:TatD family hydrolase n=1 Tax=Olsenella profusa TaxID=138595 RepID=A0ABS2EZ98_9ACTN|nr:TatD family hydrolase [Olsenella profusa]MBM6774020.1 TatD family hydrolase [Olsenella profusa]